MNDPPTASSSYSMEPLLDALSGHPHAAPHQDVSASPTSATYDNNSSGNNSIIEGGIVVLRPPLACWTSNTTYQRVVAMNNDQSTTRTTGSMLIAFPRARLYEPGWILHCVAVHGNRITPQEWHTFMTCVQTKLNSLMWYQVTALSAPICIMSILDVFDHMTELLFWCLFASIFVIGVPLTLYFRYAFHLQMQALVQEWRHYFYEDGLILEYQQHTVYQLLFGCCKGSESYLIWKRPIDTTTTASGPTPV